MGQDHDGFNTSATEAQSSAALTDEVSVLLQEIKNGKIELEVADGKIIELRTTSKW